MQVKYEAEVDIIIERYSEGWDAEKVQELIDDGEAHIVVSLSKMTVEVRDADDDATIAEGRVEEYSDEYAEVV
jgi:hypothetical protein